MSNIISLNDQSVSDLSALYILPDKKARLQWGNVMEAQWDN